MYIYIYVYVCIHKYMTMQTYRMKSHSICIYIRSTSQSGYESKLVNGFWFPKFGNNWSLYKHSLKGHWWMCRSCVWQLHNQGHGRHQMSSVSGGRLSGKSPCALGCLSSGHLRTEISCHMCLTKRVITLAARDHPMICAALGARHGQSWDPHGCFSKVGDSMIFSGHRKRKF